MIVRGQQNTTIVLQQCQNLEKQCLHAWKKDHDVLGFFQQGCCQLVQDMLPSCEDGTSRNRVMVNIATVIHEHYPHLIDHVEIHAYGSTASGLYSRNSDLDLLLTGNVWITLGGHPKLCTGRTKPDKTITQSLPIEVLSAENQKDLLHLVGEALKKRNIVAGQLHKVLNTRVPLITFTDKRSGIKCDICTSNHCAIIKGQLTEALKRWADPRLEALYRLVKCWASAVEINNAKDGTLNSWSLLLMVIFHLQSVVPPLLPSLKKMCLGEDGKGQTTRIADMSQLQQQQCIQNVELQLTDWQRRCHLHGNINPAPLVELLFTFFIRFEVLISNWAQGLYLDTRVSVWSGKLVPGRPFSRLYSVPIEDPFDIHENTARSVGTRDRFQDNAEKIARAFRTGREAMFSLTEACHAHRAFNLLFHRSLPVDESLLGALPGDGTGLQPLQAVLPHPDKVSPRSGLEGSAREDIIRAKEVKLPRSLSADSTFSMHLQDLEDPRPPSSASPPRRTNINAGLCDCQPLPQNSFPWRDDPHLPPEHQLFPPQPSSNPQQVQSVLIQPQANMRVWPPQPLLRSDPVTLHPSCDVTLCAPHGPQVQGGPSEEEPNVCTRGDATLHPAGPCKYEHRAPRDGALPFAASVCQPPGVLFIASCCEAASNMTPSGPWPAEQSYPGPVDALPPAFGPHLGPVNMTPRLYEPRPQPTPRGLLPAGEPVFCGLPPAHCGPHPGPVNMTHRLQEPQPQPTPRGLLPAGGPGFCGPPPAHCGPHPGPVNMTHRLHEPQPQPTPRGLLPAGEPGFCGPPPAHCGPHPGPVNMTPRLHEPQPQPTPRGLLPAGESYAGFRGPPPAQCGPHPGSVNMTPRLHEPQPQPTPRGLLPAGESYAGFRATAHCGPHPGSVNMTPRLHEPQPQPTPRGLLPAGESYAGFRAPAQCGPHPGSVNMTPRLHEPQPQPTPRGLLPAGESYAGFRGPPPPGSGLHHGLSKLTPGLHGPQPLLPDPLPAESEPRPPGAPSSVSGPHPEYTCPTPCLEEAAQTPGLLQHRPPGNDHQFAGRQQQRHLEEPWMPAACVLEPAHSSHAVVAHTACCTQSCNLVRPDQPQNSQLARPPVVPRLKLHKVSRQDLDREFPPLASFQRSQTPRSSTMLEQVAGAMRQADSNRQKLCTAAETMEDSCQASDVEPTGAPVSVRQGKHTSRLQGKGRGGAIGQETRTTGLNPVQRQVSPSKGTPRNGMAGAGRRGRPRGLIVLEYGHVGAHP